MSAATTPTKWSPAAEEAPSELVAFVEMLDAIPGLPASATPTRSQHRLDHPPLLLPWQRRAQSEHGLTARGRGRGDGAAGSRYESTLPTAAQQHLLAAGTGGTLHSFRVVTASGAGGAGSAPSSASTPATATGATLTATTRTQEIAVLVVQPGWGRVAGTAAVAGVGAGLGEGTFARSPYDARPLAAADALSTCHAPASLTAATVRGAQETLGAPSTSAVPSERSHPRAALELRGSSYYSPLLESTVGNGISTVENGPALESAPESAPESAHSFGLSTSSFLYVPRCVFLPLTKVSPPYVTPPFFLHITGCTFRSSFTLLEALFSRGLVAGR